MLVESNKFGTARFAKPEEISGNRVGADIYIGGGYTFSDKGHILTVAGTRGGKGTNLIIPNLLGVGGGFQSSWFVIDPKGENAAIRLAISAKPGRKWSSSIPRACYRKRSGKLIAITRWIFYQTKATFIW